MMSSKNRFWLFTSLAAGVTFLLFFSMLIFMWQSLAPEHQSVLIVILKEYSIYFFTGFLLFFAALAFALDAILNNFFIPMGKLADEATAIATVNPSHRINIEGGREVVELAGIINDFADIYEELNQNVLEEIRNARADAEKEKNLLASFLDGLPQGIMACNAKGRIILFNREAKRLLESFGCKDSSGCFVGIGRSVFGVIEKELVSEALHEMEIKRAKNSLAASVTFLTSNQRGTLIRIEASPIVDRENNSSGFIMLLHDITADSETGEAEDPAANSCGITVITEDRPEFYDFDLFSMAGKSTKLMERELTGLHYTAFDTETTGLDPKIDEIISIGAVRMVNSRLLTKERFDQLIYPGIPVPWESTKIHGINGEMLEGEPVIETVLPLFRKFAEETVLVAHNGAFDMRMFEVKEQSSGVRFKNPVLDTMLLAAVAYPGHGRHDMRTLARLTGVTITNRHTAMGDAVTTGQIFLKLISILAKKGIHTLREALDASKKSMYANLKY